MNSFYLTLPSNSNGQEFPHNASNSYKVRLPDPIRLEGEWEVGLSAVALPDIAPQVKALIDFKTDHFLRVGWNYNDTTVVTDRSKQFKLDQFTRAKPRDGVELCKLFVAFCHNVRTHRDLTSTYHKNVSWLLNGKKLYIDVKMDGEDMVFDNEDVDSVTQSIFIDFDEGFAAAMKWVEYKADGTPLLGPNLQMTVSRTINLDAPGVAEDVQLAGTSTAVYWTVKNGYLQLSRHASWRFVNINQAFRDITDYNSRSLFVYSNVGQSQVVGNKVTDLLREVPYESKGRGSQYVEPTHIQYKKVRNTMLDIIEVQVAETDGKLTVFREGVTTLTLHFRQIA